MQLGRFAPARTEGRSRSASFFFFSLSAQWLFDKAVSSIFLIYGVVVETSLRAGLIYTLWPPLVLRHFSTTRGTFGPRSFPPSLASQPTPRPPLRGSRYRPRQFLPGETFIAPGFMRVISPKIFLFGTQQIGGWKRDFWHSKITVELGDVSGVGLSLPLLKPPGGNAHFDNNLSRCRHPKIGRKNRPHRPPFLFMDPSLEFSLAPLIVPQSLVGSSAAYLQEALPIFRDISPPSR